MSIAYPMFWVLVLWLSFSTLLQGQAWAYSEPLEGLMDSETRLLGYWQDSLYLYRYYRQKPHIQVLDSQLRAQRLSPLELAESNGEIYELWGHRQGIALLYTAFRRNKLSLRLANYNWQGQCHSDSLVYEWEGRVQLPPMHRNLSENKQRLLLYFQEAKTLVWLVLQLDQGRLVWQAQYDLETTRSERLDLFKGICSNQDQAYFLFHRTEGRGKAQAREFWILQSDSAGSVRRKALNLPSKPFWLDVDFVYDELNRQLLGAGLHGDNDAHSKGCFYWRYHPDSSQPILHYTVFDTAFRQSIEQQRRRAEKGLRYFRLRDLVPRQDGGLLFIAEQQIRFNYQSSGLFFPEDFVSTQSDHQYDYLILCTLHPDGRLHWRDVIFKSQHAENDQGRYASYALMRNRNRLRLLFNEEIKTRPAIVDYQVSALGELQRQRLLLNAEPPLLPLWRQSFQADAQTLFILAESQNRWRVLRWVY